MNTERCCRVFNFATEEETDNEGYGRLIYEAKGLLKIGDDRLLPPIKFCPWCGREVKL